MEQGESPFQPSVQFSRTHGIASATALGGSVVLAIGIFVAGSQIIQQTGTDAPLVFFVTALLFFPILLSCVQRSSGAISTGSFYAAAKASGSALRLFFTVWIMLGGYIALGALLAYTTAVRILLVLQRMLGLQIEIQTIILLVMAGVLLKEILGKGEAKRGRTVIFWSCTIFLLVLVAWGFIAQYRAGVKTPRAEPLQHWLLAVSMMASTLWSMDIILNYRGQYREPNRTTFWSLVAIFCGGNLLFGLVSILALRNPALLVQNWLSVLTWNESRLEILILIAGFLICSSGLFRVMTRITRLVGSMILDGSLPVHRSRSGNDSASVTYYVALFCSVVALCAVTLSVSHLLLDSAFAALFSMLLYLHPLVRKDLSRTASLVLPLHPLVPVTAIVLVIFLMWILPVENLIGPGLWLLGGAILFFTFARKRMAPSLQQEHIFAGKTEPAKAVYRVLVYLSDEILNESLLRIGSSLAAAKSGELLVLRILETSDLVPASEQRRQGEKEWNRIREELQKISLPGQLPTPVIRMAPDSLSGIQATARELNTDFILLEWPEESTERLRKSQLQAFLQISPKPLGILKGQIPQKPLKVSVACGRSPHAILALQTGQAIASVNHLPLSALRVFSKFESDHEARTIIQTSVRESGIELEPEVVTAEQKDVEEGILEMAQESELLLVGASDDPLSGRPLPDGQAMEIARQRKGATLILKCKEEPSRFLLRRLLAQMTNHITALTLKERAELMGQLKVGLQARADFYLMVALAAAIAITGLIMNDGSIVLGAMLVSPLMGPIVGIACGIALGNIDLMRRSGASTFKGMTLVLGVGVVMTFLLPHVEPTDQILSRTHPGIFDLLAALAAGAAGAYSLGKKPVAGALPGVAMSLSLEPPLAVAGYGLSTSQFWITGGAFLLFLTNLAAMVLAGAGVYLLLGMRPPRKEGMSIVGKAVAIVILATLVLVVPLGFGTYGAVQRGHLKFQVESQFRDEAIKERFQLLDLRISEQDNGFLISPTVMAFEDITPEKIEKFRKVIEQKIGLPIQIDASIVRSNRIEAPQPK